MMKRAGIVAGVILGIAVLAFLILLMILTLTEYKPKEKEAVQVQGGKDAALGRELTLCTWNIGYTALGDYADFFMDGGKQVKPGTKSQIIENGDAILQYMQQQKADFYLLQEVDKDSHRSYHIDQTRKLSLDRYASAYARNFKVAFVPFPIPPIGKVDAGIMTLSRAKPVSAVRVSLPVPFHWPVSLANLKRCLLVNRYPVAHSGKELVVVNLHLEAYDDGAGKAEQTKALFDLLKSEQDKGNYVIAGGDFNQSFSNVDDAVFDKGEAPWNPGTLDVSEHEDFQMLMDQLTPSCRALNRPLKGADPEQFRFYAIDGFILSKNIKVQSLHTEQLNFQWSDHNPVMLRVRLD